MIEFNFGTNRYYWVETPPDADGYTFKVLTIDEEDNVVVFTRTTSKEAAQSICAAHNETPCAV